MEEENKEPGIISVSCCRTSTVVSRLFTGNTASLVGFIYFISESIRNKTKIKQRPTSLGRVKYIGERILARTQQTRDGLR